MKPIFVTSLAVGALAAVPLGLAGNANAAPSGPSSVETTIGQLEEQGFHVIVSRVRSTTEDQCAISSVRPGQTFSRRDTGAPGAGDDLVTTVINRTVYVHITCPA